MISVARLLPRMSRIQKSTGLFVLALLVFVLFRAVLFGVHRDQFEDLGWGSVASAFWHGLRFDAASVALVFIVPLLLMNLPFKFAQHRRWFNGFAWLLYGLTAAMAFLLAADIVYFEFVSRHIGSELLLIANDTTLVADIALGGYKWATVTTLVFAALLFMVWRRVLAIELAPAPRFLPVKFVVLLLGIIVIGRGGVTGKPISVIDAFSTGETSFGNLVLNGVFTAAHAGVNSKSANHHFFAPEDIARILFAAQSPADPEYPMLKRYPGSKTGYNVVLLMLESWDAKYIDSFSGNGYKATPFFDTLVAGGLKFSNFYAAGQRSIEGIQGALVGLPILTGMPVIGSGLEVSKLSHLGGIAKSNGYKTLFIQAPKRASFRYDSIAAATGFDTFYGMEDIPLLLDYPDPGAARYGWDYDTLQFAKQQFDATQGPFLSFVFTGTTHIEFPRVPARFEIRPHSATGEDGLLNSLHYADWSLGEFFKAARQSTWFDNTIFILCADHTFGHYKKTGSFTEKFHIPFLIYAPGLYQPRAVATVGSQLDIMPTIIDMLGFDNAFSAVGESLFRKREEYAFVTEGGSIIGLIAPRGYLKHSLHNRMETGVLQEPGPTLAEYDAMEQKLLALDQTVYELIRANKWAR